MQSVLCITFFSIPVGIDIPSLISVYRFFQYSLVLISLFSNRIVVDNHVFSVSNVMTLLPLTLELIDYSILDLRVDVSSYTNLKVVAPSLELLSISLISNLRVVAFLRPQSCMFLTPNPRVDDNPSYLQPQSCFPFPNLSVATPLPKLSVVALSPTSVLLSLLQPQCCRPILQPQCCRPFSKLSVVAPFSNLIVATSFQPQCCCPFSNLSVASPFPTSVFSPIL